MENTYLLNICRWPAGKGVGGLSAMRGGGGVRGRGEGIHKIYCHQYGSTGDKALQRPFDRNIRILQLVKKTKTTEQ